MANEIFSLFGSIFVENDQANRAIDETDQRAERTSGTFGKMGEVVGKVGGILGGALVAGAGAAVAGLGALFVAGDNMQQAMNKLQQQTGATEAEMKGMEESLKNIYKNNYGESFEDISSAMANVKQVTGATGAELESMTQTALMMRDTFDFEVNESMRTVSVMMKNFGITSEEAFTLLAQGQQMGVNASDDMLDTFLEYSPLFKQLGFDAEGMLDVLNTGMKAGVRNSDVLADTVKEFGIRVKDGSKLTAESFKAIGLNADKMAEKFAQGGESAQEAFSETMEALSKIEDPIARNTAGVGLFGTKFEDLEYQAVLALGNVESVANMSGDTLAKINEIKYDSLGEALQGIGRNLMMGVFEPFQEKVMPVVNEFANWIAEKMPVVEDVTNKTFTKIFDLAEKVWIFFKDNILPIFIEWYGNINEYFPIIRAVAETVFGALLAVAKSLWDFFKVNLLPIFVSLFEWVQGHLPTIQSTFSTVFNAIKTVINVVWGIIKDNILPILERLFSWLQSKMPIIQSIFEGVFTIVKNVISAVWDIIENFLLPVIKGLVDYIVSPVFTVIQTIIEGVFDAIFWAVDKVVKVFEAVTGAIKTAIDWLTFWNNSEVEDKNVNVNTNYTSSGSDVPRNATGTNYFSGGVSLVGERGPELVSLPRGTKISPANETRKMLGGNMITQNITINSPKALSPSEIARKNLQISRRLAMEWGL